MLVSTVSAFRWNAQDDTLEVLDQLALPVVERFVALRTVYDVERAIIDMLVRGAPAIGIVAAYGMYYSARAHWGKANCLALIEADHAILAKTRPTAVNLFWALERMMTVIKEALLGSGSELVLAEAAKIWAEDIEMNRALSEHGADAIGLPANILTHCNAGAIATGGIGTALGVIRAIDARKRAKGERLHVWVDETRPYLQGARLTAWELMKDGIDCTLISDNMAAYFMQAGLVDAVVLGADRIAKNGDTANKIGTYGLAVLAKHHGIPFYTAAPHSTFDPALETGKDIVIEERSADELIYIKGQAIAPLDVKVRHPAFDVTPASLITGIITPDGVWDPRK